MTEPSTPCYLHVNCVANAKRQRLTTDQPQPCQHRLGCEEPHGLQEHTCEYCASVFLSSRLEKHPAALDMNLVTAAYKANCVMYQALVDKLTEAGRTLDDLLPCMSLYQDWNTDRYQDGRHLTLHLARDHERFCDGVAYRLYSGDSVGHGSQCECAPMICS